MTIPTDAAYADQLDADDSLAGFRDRFVAADPDSDAWRAVTAWLERQ